MLRACLMAFDSRRWCVVHTPVNRRGTILPRSATKPCNRRTSRYEMASIFSVQNLQTFLRRKNLRPPGPPAPGAPAGRGVRGPAPGPEWPPLGGDEGACCSVECVLVSSAMMISSQVRCAFLRSRLAMGISEHFDQLAANGREVRM